MQQISTFTSRYILKNVARMQIKKSTKETKEPPKHIKIVIFLLKSFKNSYLKYRLQEFQKVK